MKNKQERVNLLVESLVGEIKPLLQEVRLPSGYFQVQNDFSFKDASGEWDVPFVHGDLVYVDPIHKILKIWSSTSRSWQIRNISFKEFIKPDVYRVFANSTFRVNPLDVRNKVVKPGQNVEFKTTVNNFANRVNAYNLDPDTKIRVVVIE
jgi:hypothetical protein